MSREVDAREKELTHLLHRDLLKQNLNEVKSLTPSLISSIKIYLAIKNNNNNQNRNNGLSQAEQNRDYIIKTLFDKINEIIRILQLKTYEEDESLNDDIALMKQNLVCSINQFFFLLFLFQFINYQQIGFEGRLKHASEWLLDENAIIGDLGEKSFKDSLSLAIAIGSKIEDKTQSDYVIAECEMLNNLSNGMQKFISEGKVIIESNHDIYS